MSYVKHTVPQHTRLHRPYLRWLCWLCILVFQPIYAQGPATPEATPPIEEEPANSLPPEPVPNQPVAERLAEQKRQLLHDVKGPPIALWLPVDDQQVLAFWQPDRSGKPLGAVLMLHDQGENPRRAATLRRLHEYLPTHGWATFSVELPDLPEAVIPARSDPPAQQDESADESALVDGNEVTPPETADEALAKIIVDPPTVTAALPPSRAEVIEQIHRRIQAATAYLHQQGQYNLVLLGEGSSSHWASQHLDRAVPPPPVESADKKSKGIIDRTFRAVVLVNPHTPDGAELASLHDELRHPEIPTLDVFTDFHLDTLAAAQSRRQSAKQKGYENYVVRRLPPPSGADPGRTDTLLTKAVRGFLHKYAQGVELE